MASKTREVSVCVRENLRANDFLETFLGYDMG